jgi:hypothetical protein
VENDVAKAKRQLFIFIDQYLILIATLMVQMFSMHTKILKPKYSYQKLGISTQLFSHLQTLHSNITQIYQSVKKSH